MLAQRKPYNKPPKRTRIKRALPKKQKPIVQVQKKKKIVFLCNFGRWGSDAGKQFRFLLQNRGVEGKFEILAAGVSNKESHPNLKKADIVVSPFFGSRNVPISEKSLALVKKVCPKASLYKVESTDLRKLFSTILAYELNQ